MSSGVPSSASPVTHRLSLRWRSSRSPGADRRGGGGCAGATCERCGDDVAFSHRLDRLVCPRCYHCSFTAAELTEAKRVQRQGGLARVIRGVAERADGPRRQRLRDRALLIEVADREEDVLPLIDEVRALGVRLEVRR